jgi:polyisoprenoid-binding protein YceI
MAMFGAIALVLTFNHIQKTTLFAIVCFLAIYCLFLIMIPLAGLQKEDLGGPLYLLFFLLFSVPIVILWQKNKPMTFLPIFPLIFGTVAFLLPSFAIPTDPVSKNENKLVDVPKASPVLTFEQQTTLLPTFIEEKKYEIDSDSSTILFELGTSPSITKGSFSKWNGSFKLRSATEGTLSVNLPLPGMSTKNEYRDESLMSKGYFDKAKTPTINYELVANLAPNHIFSGVGTLKMATGKENISAKFKVIRETSTHIIATGTLEVDRTKFGMLSDPKIGDIVRVNVQAFFKK